MRFSRLEIKGFKSFANETVIHFNEDVTGIVGPNGSGKSNIVDAIRWVLGEQKSTELRLDKMSNIIFNGTKSKKPAGMAQVSLVFENNKKILPLDFNEVTVTRILYQNGDSEYKLNNVTCRLKDIYSLFVDTGVGSNTYAIIGFGMVEDLLNNKDNYRRMMIEQAAGISKYKSRKKETLSKLQSTLDDLSRVDDLLAEIEGNMNTLRKQARRAEKYLELKERYKANASTLFNHQIKSINESIISTFENMKGKEKQRN
ncbi:MAG: AAA family ATPase [Saprospiraceae bacterium]|nr:AAA family ATPase [Candidatus Brachybacter algidus]MBL0119043.1 AAA family ATPase [Candidatus Brachybacter algidus]